MLSFQATSQQHRGCIIPQDITQSSAPEDGQGSMPETWWADWNY